MQPGTPYFSVLLDRQSRKVLPFATCAEFNKKTGMLGPRWANSDKMALQRALKYLNFVHQLMGEGVKGHIRGFPGNVPTRLKKWANKNNKVRVPLLKAPRVEKMAKDRWFVDIRSWDLFKGRLYAEHIIIDKQGRIVSHKRNVLARINK